ncbi:MAG: hypothetical protein QOD00_3219 [Blastocatellia bacterium]|jgi:hypothetical protein|nr:hypothetical protein [Blastocatellia bacterium]
MAKDETKRLPARDLNDDEEIYAAVKAMADYAPANAAYTQAKLDAGRDALEAAHHALVQADAAAKAARDALVARQWEFHNLVLGTKDQIMAQYGPNSDQVQAVKLKKKSEYKSPTRKKTGGN